jgi:hypothetical protein
LDQQGKDTEFRLCLLTWYFDARWTSEISKELVDFVSLFHRGQDFKNSDSAGIVEVIWRSSKYYQGTSKESFKKFQDILIGVLVSKVLKGNDSN